MFLKAGVDLFWDELGTAFPVPVSILFWLMKAALAPVPIPASLGDDPVLWDAVLQER